MKYTDFMDTYYLHPHSVDDYQYWGLQEFVSKESPRPLGLYIRDRKLVGLEVRCKLDSAKRKTIAEMESLEILDLGQLTGFSNAWMADLAKLPHLKQLILWFTSLNDTGLKMLSQSKSIEELDIRSTKIKELGIESLGELKSLRALKLSIPSSINFACFKNLSQLSQLKMLDMKRYSNVSRYNYIEASDIYKMTDGLTSLEYLNLDCIANGPETGFKFLVNLPNLKQLSLESFEFDDDSIDTLQTYQHLKYLNLTWASIRKLSQASRLFQNLKVNDLIIEYLQIQSFDDKPKKINHIPNVYFNKEIVLESQSELREIYTQFFPDFINNQYGPYFMDYFIRNDNWTEANID